MTTNEPTFMIGSVPIHGDLILAPMDGITDNPFRALCRRLGSAMVVTEFINALDVIEDNPRYPKRTIFTEDQRPVSLQILGNDPERMLAAAIPLVENVQPDILDINLGCQSKNVTSRGAGAALMRKPEDIARIFSLMTREFTIPVTGKIRLGWDDDSLNYLEVAKIIEDNGGAMVAVHGRTRKQAYRGEARWEPIRDIKQALHIPVIGNGDVVTVADIERIKQETGCDAVMIGRAAVPNPWIFSRLGRDQISPQDVLQSILTHFKSIVAYYGEPGVITFRKYLKAYLAPYPIPREELLDLLREKDQDAVHSEIIRIFSLL
ncbi:MAG: tRNA-dihydrouridine synthase [Anaerolineaceae bacterium]|nr:tRNA-dihydrouridine synthase [Anaerolineaceae bacterium]